MLLAPTRTMAHRNRTNHQLQHLLANSAAIWSAFSVVGFTAPAASTPVAAAAAFVFSSASSASSRAIFFRASAKSVDVTDTAGAAAASALGALAVAAIVSLRAANS